MAVRQNMELLGAAGNRSLARSAPMRIMMTKQACHAAPTRGTNSMRHAARSMRHTTRDTQHAEPAAPTATHPSQHQLSLADTMDIQTYLEVQALATAATPNDEQARHERAGDVLVLCACGCAACLLAAAAAVHAIFRQRIEDLAAAVRRGCPAAFCQLTAPAPSAEERLLQAAPLICARHTSSTSSGIGFASWRQLCRLGGRTCGLPWLKGGCRNLPHRREEGNDRLRQCRTAGRQQVGRQGGGRAKNGA